MIRLLLISWRNFIRNFNRFRMLFIAVVSAVALITILLAFIGGFTQTIRLKASRYFSGDVGIQAFQRTQSSHIPDPEAVLKIAESIDIPVKGVIQRSIYYHLNGSLFFNGNYAKQRRLVGVDWERERNIFEALSLSSGTYPEAGKSGQILISTKTAERLGARAGDILTVSLQTAGGQQNTERLYISGIFEENSFFGYASYMDRTALNRVMMQDESFVTEIGVYVNDEADQQYVYDFLYDALSKDHAMFQRFYSRQERYDALRTDWDGIRYAVLTLDLQVDDISALIDALRLISYVLFVVFMLIIVVGVSNTYSIIVHERVKEIGTLRALGMTKGKTVFVILSEAFFLGLYSVTIGSVVGIGLTALISAVINVNGINVMELFLVGGKLPFVISFGWMLIVAFITCVSAVIGAGKPAIDASQFAPADAMRQE